MKLTMLILIPFLVACFFGFIYYLTAFPPREASKVEPVSLDDIIEPGESVTMRIPIPVDIDMNVSAYCPCEKCCGRWADGITASGVNVKDFHGLLVAAPPEYPFGTIMDIPGYGIATVQDRGGAIKGNKLDLYFSTHQEALNWGRKQLKVRILK